MPAPRTRRRLRLRLAGCAVALLAACGGSGGPADVATTDGEPPAGTGQSSGPAALAGAATIEGTAFDVDALAGRDAVAWFWAPWCVICRGEGPEVADVAARYADQLTLFGVAGRGELDEMAGFVNDTGTGDIAHVADLDGSIWSAFGVYGQPAFAFIDDDGTVEVFVGSLGGDALAERIDALLAG